MLPIRHFSALWSIRPTSTSQHTFCSGCPLFRLPHIDTGSSSGSRGGSGCLSEVVGTRWMSWVRLVHVSSLGWSPNWTAEIFWLVIRGRQAKLIIINSVFKSKDMLLLLIQTDDLNLRGYQKTYSLVEWFLESFFISNQQWPVTSTWEKNLVVSKHKKIFNNQQKRDSMTKNNGKPNRKAKASQH